VIDLSVVVEVVGAKAEVVVEAAVGAAAVTDGTDGSSLGAVSSLRDVSTLGAVAIAICGVTSTIAGRGVGVGAATGSLAVEELAEADCCS
jgi:hypothetical protein